MRREENPIYKNAMKVAKRIAITILCCIPVIVIFSYYTRNVIKSSVLQILCYMLIMGFAVLIEEIVVRNKEKQKKENAMFNDKKDVFK